MKYLGRQRATVNLLLCIATRNAKWTNLWVEWTVSCKVKIGQQVNFTAIWDYLFPRKLKVYATERPIDKFLFYTKYSKIKINSLNW